MLIYQRVLARNNNIRRFPKSWGYPQFSSKSLKNFRSLSPARFWGFTCGWEAIYPNFYWYHLGWHRCWTSSLILFQGSTFLLMIQIFASLFAAHVLQHQSQIIPNFPRNHHSIPNKIVIPGGLAQCWDGGQGLQGPGEWQLVKPVCGRIRCVDIGYNIRIY